MKKISFLIITYIAVITCCMVTSHSTQAPLEALEEHNQTIIKK